MSNVTDIDSLILPPLREDIEISPVDRNLYGQKTWVIHDPLQAKFYRIGEHEFSVIDHWQSGHTVQQMLEYLKDSLKLEFSFEDLKRILNFLTQHALIKVPAGNTTAHMATLKATNKANKVTTAFNHMLFLRLPLFKPDRFLEKTLPYISFVYTRPFFIGLFFLLLTNIYLLSRNWDAFITSFPYLFSVGGIISFVVTLSIMKILHELGHAYTTKYFGLHVPTIGVAILLFFPVLYTDTTESWKLQSRWQRFKIGASGIGTEIIFALFALTLWHIMPEGGVKSALFIAASTSWILTIIININPLIKFDGYYLLSDFWNIDNLQDRSLALAKWQMGELLFGFKAAPSEIFPRHAYRKLMLYAYALMIYRFILFFGIALLLYNLFFKPLGLILMATSLYLFIGKPVIKQMHLWWNMRTKMQKNKQTKRTIAIACALLFFLFVPWQGRMSLPALLSPTLHTNLHIPVAAQLQEIHVTQGQLVSKGDILARFTSPDLVQKITDTEIELNLVDWKIKRALTSQDFLDNLQVLQQEKIKQQNQLAGLQDTNDNLILRAPWYGKVVYTAPSLENDSWFNKDSHIVSLANTSNTKVEAYIHERDLNRISLDAKATFRAENNQVPPVKLKVINIDASSVLQLEDPYNASIFDGPIAARPQESGVLIPDQPVYRVSLIPTQKNVTLNHITRGTIHVRGKRQSLFSKMGSNFLQIIIRESGF